MGSRPQFYLSHTKFGVAARLGIPWPDWLYKARPAFLSIEGCVFIVARLQEHPAVDILSILVFGTHVYFLDLPGIIEMSPCLLLK